MDFGFVGGAYEAPNLYMDAQKCVNWYPEIDPAKGAKGERYGDGVIGLLGCPGLNQVIQLGSGPIRGCWAYSDTSSLWVSGNQVYRLDLLLPASSTNPATFSGTPVGTIGSAVGPVVMQDNGAGGFVFISDGTNGYTYSIATAALTAVVDPAFFGTARISFIDGYLIFNKPNSQIFYISPNYSVGLFNASMFDLNDISTDQLVTHIAEKRALWLINQKATQVWYNAGGALFPFQRIDGAMFQVGCAAAQSLARFNDGLVWLARSDRGQNVIIQTQGYSYQVISTRAVEHAIASYPVVSDAIAYTYQEEGHEFYVITFPTQDVTWVYDGTSGLWHQRLSFDPNTGLFHRHRSNCYLNFQNQRLVGDYQNGRVYSMSRQYFTDNGAPLVAWRRTPHVWDGDRRARVFHSRLQIEFAAGVGLQVGQGSNPQAMVKWSDDGGATYGSEHWTSIGAAGQTKNRAIWRRLGQARDRIYDVRFSDPTSRDIVGATLDLDVETDDKNG